MQLIAPTDRALSCPFRIPDGPSHSGPRIGGLAPSLPVLPDLRPSAEYIITFPLCVEPVLYASLFRNCDPDEFFHALNDGFMSDNRIVAAVHPDLPRGASGLHASQVSPHPLLIQAPGMDMLADGEGGLVTSSDHKLGGRPYCIQDPELEGAAALFWTGYVQVLQVDFPGFEDGNISGPWPFGDGLFNLLWRPPFLASELRWCIQK
jgi:hypothetical protein